MQEKRTLQELDGRMEIIKGHDRMQEKRTLQELDGRMEIIKGMIGCKRRGPSKS